MADFATYPWYVEWGQVKEAGAIREQLTHAWFERNGYQSLPSKCGSNCLDGVFVKDGKVYVVETKPLNGSIKLNPADSTGLPAQMSDAWIRYAYERLEKSSDAAAQATGALLRNAEKNGEINKLVVGVNPTEMKIVPLH